MLTDAEAQAVVSGFFSEYLRLSRAKGISPADAAKRLGISRTRLYQLKQGDTMVKLPTFLTLLTAVNEMKEKAAP